MSTKSAFETAVGSFAVACVCFALAGLILGVMYFGWAGLAWWFGAVGVGYFGIFVSTCRRIKAERMKPTNPPWDKGYIEALANSLRERAKFREDA